MKERTPNKKTIMRLVVQRYTDSKAINYLLKKYFFNPSKFIRQVTKNGHLVDQRNAWTYFEKIEKDKKPD